ncbi:MAG TPA: hypothetical protein VGI39_17215 [Polyangiaceae bacterium]|jgi:hypothetical protein
MIRPQYAAFPMPGTNKWSVLGPTEFIVEFCMGDDEAPWRIDIRGDGGRTVGGQGATREAAFTDALPKATQVFLGVDWREVIGALRAVEATEGHTGRGG